MSRLKQYIMKASFASKADQHSALQIADGYERELAELRGTLRYIASMAGGPDAAEACRNIIAECRDVTKIETGNERR